MHTRKVEWVYLILNHEKRMVKIGYTADLNTRIRQIELSSGTKLELICAALIDSSLERPAKDVESYLHERCKKKRGIGEWFKLNHYDVIGCVMYLKSLNTNKILHGNFDLWHPVCKKNLAQKSYLCTA